MEAIVKLILLIGQPAVLLCHEVDVGVFFPLAVTVILRHFLEDYALVFHLRVDAGCHFLQLVIHYLSDVLLYVVQHIVEIALDLLHYLVHLFFFVVPARERRVSEHVHVSFNLVVDVVVRPDGLF